MWVPITVQGGSNTKVLHSNLINQRIYQAVKLFFKLVKNFLQLSLDRLSMKFERMSQKLCTLTMQSRLEITRIEIMFQLHHMFAIWILYLKAKH